MHKYAAFIFTIVHLCTNNSFALKVSLICVTCVQGHRCDKIEVAPAGNDHRRKLPRQVKGIVVIRA